MSVSTALNVCVFFKDFDMRSWAGGPGGNPYSGAIRNQGPKWQARDYMRCSRGRLTRDSLLSPDLSVNMPGAPGGDAIRHRRASFHTRLPDIDERIEHSGALLSCSSVVEQPPSSVHSAAWRSVMRLPLSHKNKHLPEMLFSNPRRIDCLLATVTSKKTLNERPLGLALVVAC